MHDAGPARQRGPEPHHRDELARRGVVEDALVAAQAARAAERAGGDAVPLFFRREGGVGVPGAPLGVFGEGSHDGECGGPLVDGGCLDLVFLAAGDWGRGRGDDEADVLACDAADEEEDGRIDVGTEGASGSWWGRVLLLGWTEIAGFLRILLVLGVIGSLPWELRTCWIRSPGVAGGRRCVKAYWRVW